MYILLIILILIIFLLCFYIYNIKDTLKNKIELDEKTQEENIELSKKKAILINEQELLQEKLKEYNTELSNIQNHIKHMENISNGAFKEYCDLLEQSYKNKDNEYDR